ncbi:MAG: D-aminoacyl-tRNA deacylase [Candidatus Woesearchaeota archaeon]
MNFFIITSTKDLASQNIKNILIENFPFKKINFEIFNFSSEKNIINAYILENEKKEQNIILIETNSELIFFDTDLLENINFEKNNFESNLNIKPDYLIFASKHQSKSNEKTLSVHYTGNFSKAEYGGIEGKFSKTDPLLMKIIFNNLNKNSETLKKEFNITLEATHHGPYSEKPLLFIEIGSTKDEWQNQEAGFVISKTIIDSIKNFYEIKDKKKDNIINDAKDTKKEKIALCFGGLHYCSNFNKILLNPDLSSKILISHICPKYNIKNLNIEKLENLKRSADKIDFALLDWKGLSSEDKKFLLPLLEKSNLSFEKI